MNIGIISHFIFPGYTNNHKAKLLHSSSIVFLVVFLVTFRLVLVALASPKVSVLGYSANIPPNKIVEITNEKRYEAGVGPLTFNEALAEAAKLKALDMLAKDYWAHVAPDGTEPWDFFRTVGYTYRFAGENLARDFTNAQEVVDAWLASPSHRDNLLSGKYTEIGVAVVEGDLNGEDATLIVQLLGAPVGTSSPVVSVVAAEVSRQDEPIVESVVPEEVHVPAASEPVLDVSGFDVMRTVTVGIVFILVVVLAFDVVFISKKGIVRAGGRAFAHLSFMTMILIILLLVRSGEIV